MWLLQTVNISLPTSLRGGEASLLKSSSPIFGNYTSYTDQDEGCRIYLRPEEQGRRRRHGALPLRAEPDHIQVQDPTAGRANDRLSPGYEQLLQQAERTCAHPAHQQEGKQSGDPPARDRLYLGPAGRAGRAGEEPPALRRHRPSHTADHSKRRTRQHRSREWLLR